MAILRRTSVIDGKLVVEEIEQDDLITVRKKDKLNGGDFIFLFQNAILKIVTDGNLSKGAYQILLYLMAKTEFEKEISATLYGIAKELKMAHPNATTAMKELETISVVIRNKELRTFRLNYEIAFKGSNKNYNKLKFNDPKLLEEKKHQTSLLDQQGLNNNNNFLNENE